MTWFKLDDRFFDNPKIAALSDAAQLAYIKGGTYCARELTDGFIPFRKAREYATPKVIKELVPGLWETCGEGFKVHDYLKYNPTREQVQTERDAAKRRMFALRSGEQHANGNGSSDAPVPLPVTPSRSKLKRYSGNGV